MNKNYHVLCAVVEILQFVLYTAPRPSFFIFTFREREEYEKFLRASFAERIQYSKEIHVSSQLYLKGAGDPDWLFVPLFSEDEMTGETLDAFVESCPHSTLTECQILM